MLSRHAPTQLPSLDDTRLRAHKRLRAGSTHGPDASSLGLGATRRLAHKRHLLWVPPAHGAQTPPCPDQQTVRTPGDTRPLFSSGETRRCSRCYGLLLWRHTLVEHRRPARPTHDPLLPHRLKCTGRHTARRRTPSLSGDIRRRAQHARQDQHMIRCRSAGSHQRPRTGRHMARRPRLHCCHRTPSHRRQRQRLPDEPCSDINCWD
jgi:hypothetical protein